jgi:hypothetical protein
VKFTNLWNLRICEIYEFVNLRKLGERGNMFRASSILMGVTKKVIKSGSGSQVRAGQNLTVHCTGKLADGKKFWRYHNHTLSPHYNEDSWVAITYKSCSESSSAGWTELIVHWIVMDKQFFDVGNLPHDLPSISPSYLYSSSLHLSNSILAYNSCSTKDPGQQPFSFQVGKGTLILTTCIQF